MKRYNIDLLAQRLNAEKSQVEKILQEICLLSLSDGFQMQLINAHLQGED